jgi:hypothetical protein
VSVLTLSILVASACTVLSTWGSDVFVKSSKTTVVSCVVLDFLSLAVSLRTARFNIKNYLRRSLCVVYLVRISEQTATFTLYIINLLVIITVMESVYCAVRTDSLYEADYV